MKKIFIFLVTFFIIKQIEATTDKYRLSFRDDPATTIVIGWNQVNGSNAKVYYGTQDFGTVHTLYPYNHGVDRTVNHLGMVNCFARLTGLQPNTVYYFVIKDDNSVSPRMSFKTLPDNPNTPIMFISGGDTRTGAITEYQYQYCRDRRKDGNILVSKIRPDFIAFSGDYTFLSTNSQWADWFDDWQLTRTQPEGRMYPIIPTFGNHEVSDDIYKLFDIPNAQSYYALSIGGNLLRLYSLNSDLDACTYTPQKTWLTNDLQLYTNTAIEPYWKMAQYHNPMVPHGEYSPVQAQIDCWATLFRDYKVKVAMEGHTHVIKQTWPIVPSTGPGSQKGFIRDDANGCVYIGEGCWGAPLRNLYTPNIWTRDQDRFNGYQLVYVSKARVEIRTVKFENVSSVGQVPMNAPVGTLPSGLVLWNPPNGQVVVIQHPTYVPGTDASLSSLTTSIGTLNPPFHPNTLNYTVTLPYGTTQIPQVSATPTDPNATVQITQPTSVTGTAIVKVTAENGINTRTYTVQYTLGSSNNANLASLTTSIGTLNPPFSPSILNYTVSLPWGTSTIPTVSATPADPNATIQITQPTAVDGEAIVKVTAQDGVTTKTYTVDYSILPANDATLASLVPSMGVLNPPFNPNIYNYTVLLPYGTTTIPTVTATPNDPQATVTIRQPQAVNDTAVVTVVSLDQTVTKIYKVIFTTGSSDSKEITSFTIAGQEGPTIIDQQNKIITLTMPFGTNLTALVPTITITGVSIQPPSGMVRNFTDTVTYTVYAANGTSQIYKVKVNVSTFASNNAYLSYLASSVGQLNPPFDSTITYYTVQIPSNVNQVSIIAQTAHPRATKKIFLPQNLNGNLAQRTATVMVIAQDQVTDKLYKIVYEKSLSVSEKNKDEKTLTIYPNPTSDKINITSSKHYINSTIEIYDSFARFIKSDKINSTNKIIDISELTRGVYYLIIKRGKDVESHKIFKN